MASAQAGQYGVVSERSLGKFPVGAPLPHPITREIGQPMALDPSMGFQGQAGRPLTGDEFNLLNAQSPGFPQQFNSPIPGFPNFPPQPFPQASNPAALPFGTQGITADGQIPGSVINGQNGLNIPGLPAGTPVVFKGQMPSLSELNAQPFQGTFPSPAGLPQNMQPFPPMSQPMPAPQFPPQGINGQGGFPNFNSQPFPTSFPTSFPTAAPNAPLPQNLPGFPSANQQPNALPEQIPGSVINGQNGLNIPGLPAGTPVVFKGQMPSLSDLNSQPFTGTLPTTQQAPAPSQGMPGAPNGFPGMPQPQF